MSRGFSLADAPYEAAFALVDKADPTAPIVNLVEALRTALVNIEVREQPSLKHEGDGQDIVGIRAQALIAADRARRGAEAELEFEIAPLLDELDLRSQMCEIAATCEIPVFKRIVIGSEYVSFAGWVRSASNADFEDECAELVLLLSGARQAVAAVAHRTQPDGSTLLRNQVALALTAIDARGGLVAVTRATCRALLRCYIDDHEARGRIANPIVSIPFQSQSLEYRRAERITVVLPRPGIPTRIMFPPSTARDGGWEIGSIACDDQEILVADQWLAADVLSFDSSLVLPICHRRLSITVRHNRFGESRSITGAALMKTV